MRYVLYERKTARGDYFLSVIHLDLANAHKTAGIFARAAAEQGNENYHNTVVPFAEGEHIPGKITKAKAKEQRAKHRMQEEAHETTHG